MNTLLQFYSPDSNGHSSHTRQLDTVLSHSWHPDYKSIGKPNNCNSIRISSKFPRRCFNSFISCLYLLCYKLSVSKLHCSLLMHYSRLQLRRSIQYLNVCLLASSRASLFSACTLVRATRHIYAASSWLLITRMVLIIAYYLGPYLKAAQLALI